jgi:hypothetical protein
MFIDDDESFIADESCYRWVKCAFSLLGALIAAIIAATSASRVQATELQSSPHIPNPLSRLVSGVRRQSW